MKFHSVVVVMCLLITQSVYSQKKLITTHGDTVLVVNVTQDEDFVFFTKYGSDRGQQKIPKSLVSEIISIATDGSIILRAGDMSRELVEKLAETRFANLNFTKEIVDFIINNPQNPEVLVYLSFVKYLEEDLNFEKALVTNEQLMQVNSVASSICDIVLAQLEIGEFESDLAAVGKYPCALSFSFCDGSVYRYELKVNVTGMTNYSKKFRKIFQRDILNNLNHSTSENLKLDRLPLVMTEKEIQMYIDSSETKPHEGIFELFSSESNTAEYKIGKEHEVLILCNIDYKDRVPMSCN